MKGKLIVIEGTDCSGKQTQSELLLEHLKRDGIRIEKYSFPNYQSPTGKIVGGPYLGKEAICEGWFEEGATNVDPLVSAFYYVADRKYNIPKIQFLLENGVHVILDRYSYSNMAHQGGKIEDAEQRQFMYYKLESLEFRIAELPEADIKIFLHMPYELACVLREGRHAEAPDQNERDEKHLRNAEKAYLEIANRYQFKTIQCDQDGQIRSIEAIEEELYQYVKSALNSSK